MVLLARMPKRWYFVSIRNHLYGVRRMAMPFDPEDAYYEWQDRVNVLQDLIDAIDSRMG